jgi:hypothetical protein
VSGDGGFISRRRTGEGSLPRRTKQKQEHFKWQMANGLRFVERRILIFGMPNRETFAI